VSQKAGDRREKNIITAAGHDPESTAADEFQKKFKFNLMKEFQCLNGLMLKQENRTLLNEIYTELYITEGDSGDVNKEHEVKQIEAASRRNPTEDTTIKCSDIFGPLPEHDKQVRNILNKLLSEQYEEPIRNVLTKPLSNHNEKHIRNILTKLLSEYDKEPIRNILKKLLSEQDEEPFRRNLKYFLSEQDEEPTRRNLKKPLSEQDEEPIRNVLTKPLSKQDEKPIRKVLTKGVAGIGKTVS
ncbi:NACHT, LRR and PYD domains-containing protein 3-like, partial [Silurus asotus]